MCDGGLACSLDVIYHIHIWHVYVSRTIPVYNRIGQITSNFRDGIGLHICMLRNSRCKTFELDAKEKKQNTHLMINQGTYNNVISWWGIKKCVQLVNNGMIEKRARIKKSNYNNNSSETLQTYVHEAVHKAISNEN